MPFIAVVDNDDNLLLLLRELFAEWGWKMLAHPVGSTAFDAVKREQPDAILLDLWLETSLTGWVVLQQLKMDEATRSIPVVVWSSAADQLRDKEVWLAERGIAVLFKPFNLDDLHRTLEAALRGTVRDLQP